MLKKQSLSPKLGQVFYLVLLTLAVLLRLQLFSSQLAPNMVTIPAGEFIMGLTHEQLQQIVETEKNITLPYGHPRIPGTYPPLRVWLDEYQIDRYEVTAGAYYACVGAGACSESSTEYQCSIQVSCQTDESGREKCTSEATCQPERPAAKPNKLYYLAAVILIYPKVNVTWQEAQTYCQWRGGRLPTEAEWEKAARGTDGRLYPWGNEWNAEERDARAKPGPDRSPYGVFNMAGGVREWTYDSYYTYSPYHEGIYLLGASSTNYTSQHIIRGTTVPVSTIAIVANRSRGGAFGNSSLGFRCVIGPEPRPFSEISQVLPWVPLPEPQSFDPNKVGIVYIPAEEFLYGERVREDRRTNEPISVYLDAFYIDQFEVRTADFATFLKQIGGNFRACYYQNCYYDYEWDELLATLEQHPDIIANPTWYGAYAYCQWQGGRLPTEMEWEKANPQTRFNFVKHPQYTLYEWTSDGWDTTFPKMTSELLLLESALQKQVAVRVRRGHHVNDGISNRSRSYSTLTAAFRCVYK